MDKLLFENRKYQVRQVELEDGLKRIIASTELNNRLFAESGDYKSDDARKVDEQIYFFVERTQLNLNNNELVDYVNRFCV